PVFRLAGLARPPISAAKLLIQSLTARSRFEQQGYHPGAPPRRVRMLEQHAPSPRACRPARQANALEQCDCGRHVGCSSGWTMPWEPPAGAAARRYTPDPPEGHSAADRSPSKSWAITTYTHEKQCAPPGTCYDRVWFHSMV